VPSRAGFAIPGAMEAGSARDFFDLRDERLRAVDRGA
jgi:hypothetical protein